MAKKTKAAKKKADTEYKCERQDCIYHPGKSRSDTCDYIVITGRRCRCSIENCDKYQKGERKRNSTVTRFSVVVEPHEDADIIAAADLLKDM